MAKPDQEAHFGIRLQSIRKALQEGHGQSQETQILPDRQADQSIDRQNKTLVRWEVSGNTPMHTPHNQAEGEKKVLDSLWQKEITPLPTLAVRKKPDERAKAEITMLPSVLPTPHRKDILPLTGVTKHVTRASQLLPQQEGQLQKDVGTSLIRRPVNAIQVQRGNREVALSASNLPEPRQDLSADRQVSRYAAGRGELVRLDALPLARVALSGKTHPGNLLPTESQTRKDANQLETNGEAQALGQTNKSRDQISRAEGIILNAIRSKADTDGKNARVAYEVLADMTGFSKRHVMRVVKSLIYERGMVRVDKRTFIEWYLLFYLPEYTLVYFPSHKE
jgi:hypothetical protein